MVDECKMCKMRVGMEPQYITEDSEIRLFMSTVRVPEEKKKPATKIKKVMINIGISSIVTAAVGNVIIDFLYLHRGYAAVGSEYLFIGLVFCLIYKLMDGVTKES